MRVEVPPEEPEIGEARASGGRGGFGHRGFPCSGCRLRIERIEEGAQSGGHEAAARIDHADRGGGRAERAQDFAQPARGDGVFCHVVRNLHDARACARGLDHRLAIAEAERRRRIDLHRAARVEELQRSVAPGGRQTERQAHVISERLGSTRVCRARRDSPDSRMVTRCCSPTRFPTSEESFSTPMRTTASRPSFTGSQVLVRQPDVDGEPGMSLREMREDRHDDPAPVHDRRIDAQRADGLATHARSGGLEILDLREHAFAAQIELVAVGRETHLARRAMEEPHTELRLEPRDALRNGGRRKAEIAGGTGKAAVTGSLGEGEKWLEADHGIDDIWSAMLRPARIFCR